jgi:hypothetical protein
MDRPISITMSSCDWDILLGLVTAEWSEIRKDPNRGAYYETLTAIRGVLIRRNP